MLDLHGRRHNPFVDPVPPLERSTKATSDFTVRKTSWGEEWDRNPPDDRATKAASLAKGAKSVEESRVLTALRSAPATSIADLARRAKLNETATALAVNSLQYRGLVREVMGSFLNTSLVAVALPND